MPFILPKDFEFERIDKLPNADEINHLMLIAFDPSTEEAKVANELLSDPSFLPDISYVVLRKKDKKVIACVIYSLLEVKPPESKTSFSGIALAPLAVHPEYQRQGIGSVLVSYTLSLAKTVHAFALVYGSDHYYSRFGFYPAIENNVLPPCYDWPDKYFRIIELAPNGLKDVHGVTMYPSPFAITPDRA